MDHRNQEKFRLDRFLGRSLGLTRREAQGTIRKAEVRINGQSVTDPGMHVGPDDRVSWRGQEVARPSARYVMLNKPIGVVCASRDREHRTVLDLLEMPDKTGLHVAGRLDIDTTGLVLVTDDGEWSHRLTSPRFRLPKVYRATLASQLEPKARAILENGVQLRGEPKRSAPAQVEQLDGLTVRIVITEGKYHQVKRMLAAVGNHVVALHRERIGSLQLDPSLAVGKSRPLTKEEVQAITEMIG